jgi:hypothetical protein
LGKLVNIGKKAGIKLCFFNRFRSSLNLCVNFATAKTDTQTKKQSKKTAEQNKMAGFVYTTGVGCHFLFRFRRYNKRKI